MEAVGATASIVGILSFIGHSVSGLAKLEKFFDSYKHGPKLVKKLQRDISGLETTLLEVNSVAQLLKQSPIDNGPESKGIATSIDSLEVQVKSCSDDIDYWLQVTTGLDPKTKAGFKKFFKKIKAALSGAETFQAFELDVMKHRQGIGNSLAVLTVNLIQKGHLNLDDLVSKFDGLTETHLKLNEAISAELARRAMQPNETSLEESLASRFKEMEKSIKDKLDGLSDDMSLDRTQREQEVMSLCESLSHDRYRRVWKACDRCRSKKSKCDGEDPCKRCTDDGADCTHTPRAVDKDTERSMQKLINLPPPSSARGSPTSYDMASICDSLSSIAASFSSLSASLPIRDGHIHDGHKFYSSALEQERADRISRLAGLEHISTVPKADALASKYEWACDSLSGIDCAEINGKCLYCGKAHFFETLDDSHLFGKHLVYDHSFGKCNLDLTFEMPSQLIDHLVSFHRADGEALKGLKPEELEGIFKRPQKQEDHHPYFRNIAEPFPPEPIIGEDNRKLTDLTMQAELARLLSEAGFLCGSSPMTAGVLSTLSRAIQALEEQDSQSHGSQADICSTAQKVAMIEENMILAGYDLAIAPRNLTGLPLQNHGGGAIESHFSIVWMGANRPLPAETLSYIDHPFTPRCIEECSACRRFFDHRVMNQHGLWCVAGDTPKARDQHGFWRVAGDTPKPRDVATGSRVASNGRPPLEAVFRGLHRRSIKMLAVRSKTHRINKWMEVNFMESMTLHVLLRSSELTMAFFSQDGKADYIVSILESWAEDRRLDEEDPTSPRTSDGAAENCQGRKRRQDAAGESLGAEEYNSITSLSFGSSRQVWNQSASGRQGSVKDELGVVDPFAQSRLSDPEYWLRFDSDEG